MNDREIAVRLQGQIHQFSGIFCSRFSGPQPKFIEQMLYGIQAEREVRVSWIACSPGEGVSLKKTEERLGRHLGEKGLGQEINQAVVAGGSRKIR